MSSATFTPLLPASQTPLDGALVQASAAPTPTLAALEQVGTLYDPARLQTAWLPWLAWAGNVLYWGGDELIRRRILRDNWHTHRTAGTLASYRRLARDVGARVLDALRPPDQTFLGAALSRDARNAWLRQFPQLREYPFRARGQAAGAHLGMAYPTPDGCWPAVGDALARVGEQLYLWDPASATETALTTAERLVETLTGTLVTAREVRLRGHRGALSWLGQPPRYVATARAEQRLYTLAEGTAYDAPTAQLRLVAVLPTQQPVTLAWEPVAQTGTARRDSAVFLSCRRGLGPDVAACRARTGGRAAGFCTGRLADQDAGRRIYRRRYLLIPSARAPRRGPTTHLGATRLGMPAYHARLRLDARRVASPLASYPRRPLGRYLLPTTAPAWVRQVRETLAPLRAARDRVALQTATCRPLTAGLSRFAGASLTAGDYSSEVI